MSPDQYNRTFWQLLGDLLTLEGTDVTWDDALVEPYVHWDGWAYVTHRGAPVAQINGTRPLAFVLRDGPWEIATACEGFGLQVVAVQDLDAKTQDVTDAVIRVMSEGQFGTLEFIAQRDRLAEIGVSLLDWDFGEGAAVADYGGATVALILVHDPLAVVTPPAPAALRTALSKQGRAVVESPGLDVPSLSLNHRRLANEISASRIATWRLMPGQEEAFSPMDLYYAVV